MRVILPLLLLLAAQDPAPPPAAPAPAPAPEPVLLRDAVARGLVHAVGTDPASYSQVTLSLESRSREPLTLDLAGSHAKNRTGTRCQRLGFGPTITPSGSPSAAKPDGKGRLLLDLAAGAKAELRLQTVCLDAGLPAPHNQSFEVVHGALPAVREKVLRWWVDHPDAPQSAVNAAIWQFRETVHVGKGTIEGYQEAKGTFGALHGGTAFRLHDGELMAHDPDGIARFLGTEIFQALPTADGLYAIGLGETRGPELWRHALTGEVPWGRVMKLDRATRLKRVLPAGSGRLVLVTDQGVELVTTATGASVKPLERSRVLDVSAHFVGERTLAVVLRVPGSKGVVQGGERTGEQQDVFELWSVDVRTAETKQIKRYWNTESVVAGESGIYGLTHAGKLRVLAGDDFRNLPAKEDWKRLLAVGPGVLWVVGNDGNIAAADAKSGARTFSTTLAMDEHTAVAVDGVTGDLAVVTGRRFLRVKAADGKTEEIGAAGRE